MSSVLVIDRFFYNYFHDKKVDNKHPYIVGLTTMKLKNSKHIFRHDAFYLKFDHENKTRKAIDIVCIDPSNKTSSRTL